MGLVVRWTLMVLLVHSLGISDGSGQMRSRRQTQWWQRQGGSSWGSRHTNQRFSGGHGWGDWGSRMMPHLGAVRQDLPPTPPSSGISVECGEDVRIIRVNLDFYGNGKMVKLSDLRLGPQACEPGPKSDAATAVFENSLQECSSPLQVTDQWMIYPTFLTYSPHSSSPIIRTSQATVPIRCFYPRHGNVSSKEIQPTWVPFSSTMMSEERLAFSLYLMNDDWSGPRSSSVFQLGQIFNIEASVNSQNHLPLTIYVDSCVATMTENPSSDPQYSIIMDNGCLVDGMEPDASSAFISPRTGLNKLQFTVDAFQFLNRASGTIHITCNLRVVPSTQAPDPLTKACSYSKGTKSWTEVNGPNSVCQCCSTRTCLKPGSSPPLGRLRGKREAGVYSQEKQVRLGPLTVLSTEAFPASLSSFMTSATESQDSQSAEMWVLVTVISVSMVVVAAGVLVNILPVDMFSCRK